MNILLMGGAGFIGLNIAKTLFESGHTVDIVDINSNSTPGVVSAYSINCIHQMDCSNVAGILELVDRLRIECVINLVSNLIPSSSFEEYQREQNDFMSPAFQLLNKLAIRGVKYMYFSSGGTVYGHSDQDKIPETSRRNPINYYGLSKSVYEDLVLFSNRIHKLEYLIVRPSNPFGPLQSPQKKQGLIAVVVDRMKKNQPIEIWGDGSNVRDYIWIGDLSIAISRLIDLNQWNNVYNIGSGQGCSTNEIISSIRTLIPSSSKITYTAPRSEDLSKVVLDIRKIQSTIDFKPLDFNKGLEMYVSGLKNE